MSNENSVSVYQGQDAMDDFPVLKAFQQYINAEQDKARKRMVTMCIVFSALIAFLIGAFAVILHLESSRTKELAERNQALNDRLIEFAMRERTAPQPVVAAMPLPSGADERAATEQAIRAMTESVAGLQQQLREQQNALSGAKPPAAAPGVVAASARASAELERKNSEAEARLQQLRDEIAAEKRRLAEEKERLRQQEIENYRRIHYPQYYAKQEAERRRRESEATAERAVVRQQRPVTPPVRADYEEDLADDEDLDDDLDDDLDALPGDDGRGEEATDAWKEVAAEAKPKPPKTPIGEMKPISYFSAPAKDDAPKTVKAGREEKKPAEASEDKDPKAGANDKGDKKEKSDKAGAESDEMEPITYFKDGKLEFPVEVKGSGKAAGKWRIPLN